MRVLEILSTMLHCMMIAVQLSLVRFLKKKSEGARVLQDMVAELERAFNGKVKRIKFDNGGEFVSTDMKD